jgi:predicted flap endonuclease-1-like 5' DNA nuclease
LPAPEPVTLAPEPAIEAPIDPVTEAPVLAPIEATAAETVATKAEEAFEAAAEPVIETAKATADDLTLLVGIGPKLAASLADLGVTRFEQIADWSADDLAGVDAKLNLRGRADRDAWIAQAKRLTSL